MIFAQASQWQLQIWMDLYKLEVKNNSSGIAPAEQVDLALLQYIEDRTTRFNQALNRRRPLNLGQ